MRPSSQAAQLGFSLVEMMVSMTLGLIAIAGLLGFISSHTDSHRGLANEVRLHDNLNVASDLVAHELRRAGYWRGATHAADVPSEINPNGAIGLTTSGSPAGVKVSFSRDGGNADGSEDASVRLQVVSGTLKMAIGAGTLQPVTDPDAVQVTRLTLQPTTRVVSLGHLCAPACSSTMPGCPALTIRSYDLTLDATSPTNPQATYSVHESIRVRNDDFSTVTCP